MTIDNKNNLAFSTLVIHGGQTVEATTGAVMPPIFATSTYAQKSPGQHQGFEYSRTHNPTRFAYENAVATLENGTKAFAFSSGMAAITTIMDLLPSGSHVIAMNDLYGGTFRLFDKVKRYSAGLSFSFLDLTYPKNLAQHLRPETKMIWVESPTNPLLKIVDLQEIANFAKHHNLIAVVDNTFASPALQKPLELGFDIVVHSATKYLNGHSDVIGGIAVVGTNQELVEKMAFLQNSLGAVPSPFDCYLILRGIKTLALRMEKHCDNAEAIADFLSHHPAVTEVIYPGLRNHPQHEIAKKQMKRFGGMISIRLKTDLQGTIKFLECCEIFTLAESLGGVESLIEHPAIMTHASIPEQERNKLGITDNFVRLSIGIEDKADLIHDLNTALAKIFS